MWPLHCHGQSRHETPAVETEAGDPRDVKTPRPQTPSIKSFMTPTNVKQQGGFATPTQSNQKGVWTVEDLVLKSITRSV